MNLEEEDKKQSNENRNILEVKKDFMEEKKVDVKQIKDVKSIESENCDEKCLDADDKKVSEVNASVRYSSEKADNKDFDHRDAITSEINSNESSSFEKINLKDNASIEEAHFECLFGETLRLFQKDNEVEEQLLEEAKKNILESFKDYRFEYTDFNLTENLIAYFEHYSTLNAAVSRHLFLKAINNCDTVETYVNKSELNVISLAGGPGTDMIGFCSAIQECREEQIQSLNFCIVDKWERWKSFNDIINRLLRENDYGRTSKIFQDLEMSPSFIKFDLKETDSPIYESAIGKADIVLLVRLLDIIDFLSDAKFIFRNIARRMKKDALLLLIDCGVRHYIKEDRSLSNIYVSELNPFYLENNTGANESRARIAVFVKNTEI